MLGIYNTQAIQSIWLVETELWSCDSLLTTAARELLKTIDYVVNKGGLSSTLESSLHRFVQLIFQ